MAFTSTDTITVSSLCPYILGEKGEISGRGGGDAMKCIQGRNLFIKDVEGGFVMNSLQVIHEFKAMYTVHVPYYYVSNFVLGHALPPYTL